MWLPWRFVGCGTGASASRELVEGRTMTEGQPRCSRCIAGMAAAPQRPEEGAATSWANSCPPEPRTIRQHVLSAHSKLAVVAAEIAAAHQANAGFRH